jgi:AcrR family transcriptional regulator
VARASALTPAPAERRRDARRARILDVAWELARRDGIAAISLRELADRVDMRQPSLYNYFGSKADLYDAMFAQGFAQLVDERTALRLDADPTTALRQGCRHFIDFCVRDPARYQLLFQHSVPGFHPSAGSMQIAESALGFLAEWLRAAGATDPAAVDLMRALLLGLAGEQIANEPGGRRWAQFVDEVVEVVLDVFRRKSASGRRRARA